MNENELKVITTELSDMVTVLFVIVSVLRKQPNFDNEKFENDIK